MMAAQTGRISIFLARRQLADPRRRCACCWWRRRDHAPPLDEVELASSPSAAGDMVRSSRGVSWCSSRGGGRNKVVVTDVRGRKHSSIYDPDARKSSPVGGLDDSRAGLQ
jgi:hypothetical protein